MSSEQQKHTARPGRTIVLMGPPNAGKDTQAKLLASRLGGHFIGSGDLLRTEADPRIMEVMARGELVSSEDFQRLVGQAIAKVPLHQPVVLAGIAKRPEESRWVVEHLASLDRWIDRVILLSIPMAEAVRRSGDRTHNRADDHPDVQEVRWNRFFALTKQSLAYFESLELLATIEALGEIEEVSRMIDAVLVPKVKKLQL